MNLFVSQAKLVLVKKINHNGFTLVGVMAIGAVLVIIATSGMMYINFRAKSIVADQATANSQQLQQNIHNMAAGSGSMNQTETLQFDKTLPNP